jgi:lipopolysaccharide transport system permease protein
MQAAGPTTSPPSCCNAMLHNLAQLVRYRGLIQSLVARELKARYRGSVLGFFWSFINPLLLLLVYSFVFGYILPPDFRDIPNYSLFMFCGILPWTWFTSSLLESTGVLISGGNLIKKVLFPAEVLPIVTVLANMAHFAFGLPILALFLLYFRAPITAGELLWFPVAMVVQLTFTLGCALLLSALTVHFRDIRDILGHLLTIWFFATPIIYSYKRFVGTPLEKMLDYNPMSHLIITYQEILYFIGPVGHAKWLLVLGAISVVWFLFGYFVFNRLRDTFAEEV